MLVAVGAIRIRHWIVAPAFFMFAAPSLAQARRAPGCLEARVTADQGLQFSITFWESPAAMKRYARSGAHRWAVTLQRFLGENRGFHHFHADAAVSTRQAIEAWKSAQTVGLGAGQSALHGAPNADR